MRYWNSARVCLTSKGSIRQEIDLSHESTSIFEDCYHQLKGDTEKEGCIGMLLEMESRLPSNSIISKCSEAEWLVNARANMPRLEILVSLATCFRRLQHRRIHLTTHTLYYNRQMY